MDQTKNGNQCQHCGRKKQEHFEEINRCGECGKIMCEYCDDEFMCYQCMYEQHLQYGKGDNIPIDSDMDELFGSSDDSSSDSYSEDENKERMKHPLEKQDREQK